MYRFEATTKTRVGTKSRRSSAPPKDYHASFNGGVYTDWFKNKLRTCISRVLSFTCLSAYTLVPALKRPSMIMMDNASYHKNKGKDVPNPRTMTKDELLKFVEEHRIPLKLERQRTTVVKADLVAAVATYIREEVQSEIELLASERGHLVVYTPPYCSDLEPIELVWALVKGRVRRQYNAGIFC